MTEADEKLAAEADKANGTKVYLTPELTQKFLADLRSQGRSEETAKGYERNLQKLYKSLPKEKQLTRDSLLRWRDDLLKKGYLPRTVNGHIAAANSLLNYVGRRDLQLGTVDIPGNVQPELTRNEYLRLLRAARLLGKDKAYLLTKVFGTMGIPIFALSGLTVEAVRSGWVSILSGDGQTQRLRIPPCLRRELQDYVRRFGTASGPVFRTRMGTALGRTSVTTYVQSLARDAQVAPEKCNPRCLRKLCLETQANIRDNIELLAEQAYDRLLEEEQCTVGWEDSYTGRLG